MCNQSEIPSEIGLTSEIKRLTLLVEQLQGLLMQTQAELEATQEKAAHLETENARLCYELNEMKQAPFKSKKRKSDSKDEGLPQPSKRAGRKKGHKGSGRTRPQRIDRAVRIEAGDTCPDCGHEFSSTSVERTRVVTDIEPVRPTLVYPFSGQEKEGKVS